MHMPRSLAWYGDHAIPSKGSQKNIHHSWTMPKWLLELLFSFIVFLEAHRVRLVSDHAHELPRSCSSAYVLILMTACRQIEQMYQWQRLWPQQPTRVIEQPIETARVFSEGS